VTPAEWRRDAAREADGAQLTIRQTREHIFQIRRGIEYGKATGLSVRLAFVLTDLDNANRVLESIKVELVKSTSAAESAQP
jgi:hypothetical protein